MSGRSGSRRLQNLSPEFLPDPELLGRRRKVNIQVNLTNILEATEPGSESASGSDSEKFEQASENPTELNSSTEQSNPGNLPIVPLELGESSGYRTSSRSNRIDLGAEYRTSSPSDPLDLEAEYRASSPSRPLELNADYRVSSPSEPLAPETGYRSPTPEETFEGFPPLQFQADTSFIPGTIPSSPKKRLIPDPNLRI